MGLLNSHNEELGIKVCCDMKINFIPYTSHDCVLVLCKPQYPFLGQYGVGKERLQCQKVATGGLSLLSQLCS